MNIHSLPAVGGLGFQPTVNNGTTHASLEKRILTANMLFSVVKQEPAASTTTAEVTSSSTPAVSPDDPPISKTMRYKKITKPLLERKRRARINACLDELKEIMTTALQAEGENVSKLEKADILELTVKHLHKLNQSQRLTSTPRNPLEELHKFQAGYASCAQEATAFLLSAPGVDVRFGQRLLGHLFQPGAATVVSPPTATSSPLAAAGPTMFVRPPPPVIKSEPNMPVNNISTAPVNTSSAAMVLSSLMMTMSQNMMAQGAAGAVSFTTNEPGCSLESPHEMAADGKVFPVRPSAVRLTVSSSLANKGNPTATASTVNTMNSIFLGGDTNSTTVWRPYS